MEKTSPLRKVYDMEHDLYAELRRHNLLQVLIQRRIMAEAVAHEENQEVDQSQDLEKFLNQSGFKGEDARESFLRASGLTPEDLDWQVALPHRIRAHCDKHYRHKAEAHFLSRKNQLDKVVYSMLRVKNRELALELYLRIEAGETSFSDLAAKYAEGMEQQTNGIIGPMSLTKAHPALAERLRTSIPGDIMQPFQIGEWIIIARLERYEPAIFDDAMANLMAEELFKKWVAEESSRIISQLSTVIAQVNQK